MYRLPLIVYTAWMQNDPIVKKVGLEDVYQYQTYSNVLTSFVYTAWMQYHPLVK